MVCTCTSQALSLWVFDDFEQPTNMVNVRISQGVVPMRPPSVGWLFSQVIFKQKARAAKTKLDNVLEEQWLWLAMPLRDFGGIFSIFSIGSMYGIFACIWLIFRVNVGKYTSPMDHMALKFEVFLEPYSPTFLPSFGNDKETSLPTSLPKWWFMSPKITSVHAQLLQAGEILYLSWQPVKNDSSLYWKGSSWRYVECSYTSFQSKSPWF